MTTDAKPMTAKKFVRLKTSAKASADGLIAAHKAFLNGYEFLQPIIEAYDANLILPTPTLTAIQNLLFDYSFQIDKEKAEAKIAKNIADYERAVKDENGNVIVQSNIPTGNYLVTLMVNQYNDQDQLIGVEVGIIEMQKVRTVEKDGQDVEEKYVEVKPAIWGAETYMEAQNLADRKLVSREDAQFCIIENTVGEKKVETKVFRTDSFARFYRRKAGAVMKITGKKNSTLKWVGKAQQTRSVQANH